MIRSWDSSRSLRRDQPNITVLEWSPAIPLAWATSSTPVSKSDTTSTSGKATTPASSSSRSISARIGLDLAELLEIADHQPADRHDPAVLVEPGGEPHQADALAGVAGEEQDLRPPVARVELVVAQLEQRQAGERHPQPGADVAPPLAHRPPPEVGVERALEHDRRETGPRADQEHHHDRADRAEQRDEPGHPDGGPVGGIADQALEGRREVDRHVEGEEEDGDELGDRVEPAERDRGQRDGAGDPGRDGRLAGLATGGRERTARDRRRPAPAAPAVRRGRCRRRRTGWRPTDPGRPATRRRPRCSSRPPPARRAPRA